MATRPTTLVLLTSLLGCAQVLGADFGEATPVPDLDPGVAGAASEGGAAGAGSVVAGKAGKSGTSTVGGASAGGGAAGQGAGGAGPSAGKAGTAGQAGVAGSAGAGKGGATGQAGVAGTPGGGSTQAGAAQGGTGTVCTPGQQVACACPGGQLGAQACNSTGTGFAACACSATTCPPQTFSGLPVCADASAFPCPLCVCNDISPATSCGAKYKACFEDVSCSQTIECILRGCNLLACEKLLQGATATARVTDYLSCMEVPCKAKCL